MPSPPDLIKQWMKRPLRLPRLRPHAASEGEPEIFSFNDHRADLLREVVQRCEQRTVQSKEPLEYVLNEVAYEEITRLEKQRDDETGTNLGYWKSLLRRVGKMSEAEKREALNDVCARMAEDIAANFDPRVYRFASVAVPRLLTAVLKPSALPSELLQLAGREIAGPPAIDDLLKTEGEIETIRKLTGIGTVVYVPTHSSNLDSITLGYALIREKLPPVSYGAGKNLFTNPAISFFMHNLGAYRVDRRIRARLYKDVLKTYSTVVIERGYHSLFFPGGTRSRSGMIEKHLKLGLAGTALDAYARNVVRGQTRPLFFVPTTLNYSLVLEAETLIEDWLKEAGRARYLIEDDEFSQIDRWVAFFRKLAQSRSQAVVRFGKPLDAFGNPVDSQGQSLSPDGRVIDPQAYLYSRGAPVVDAQRNAAYTRELGTILAEQYERETVLMATQIVSHVLFRRLVKATPNADLFGRLRIRDLRIPRSEVVAELGELRERLLALEAKGEVHVSDVVRGCDPNELLDRVKSAFDGYHQREIIAEEDGQIALLDPTLALYYQNRLVPYIERVAEEKYKDTAHEIVRMLTKHS